MAFQFEMEMRAEFPNLRNGLNLLITHVSVRTSVIRRMLPAGPEVTRDARRRFGIAEYLHGVSDALHVEEGSLYPALHRLESQGLIESAWGVSENNRRARFYDLTPRGRKQVTVKVSDWRRMVEAVNRVIDPSVS